MIIMTLHSLEHINYAIFVQFFVMTAVTLHTKKKKRASNPPLNPA
jgi:hypothetical protein